MERVLVSTSRVLSVIAGIGLVVMMVVVDADVLSRALFSRAVPGIDAVVANYLMVGSIFLPLAMLQMTNENIAVDSVYDLMPAGLKLVCDLLANVLTIVLYGVLAWLYSKVAVDAFEIREFVSGTWDVPTWPARIIMPLGLAFAVLVSFLNLFVAVSRYRNRGTSGNSIQMGGR